MSTSQQVAMSVDEAAAYVGVSRKSIYRAVGDGRLRAAQLHRGQKLSIRREWLDEWIEASVITAARKPVYDAAAVKHQSRRGFLEP